MPSLQILGGSRLLWSARANPGAMEERRQAVVFLSECGPLATELFYVYLLLCLPPFCRDPLKSL